jgi:hypothetical protein
MAEGIFDKLYSAVGTSVIDGPSYTVEKKGAHIQDPQRDWLFLVNIISPKFFDSEIVQSADELIIRAKSFTMPNKTVQTTELNFYGRKQVIPIEIDYDRNFNITFEESQDQFILRNFNSWLNMFDYYSDSLTNGVNNFVPGDVRKIKDDFKTNIELYMYRYNGAHEGTKITFYNAYPTGLGGATFSYDSSSKITYDIPFAYDYFTIEENRLILDEQKQELKTYNTNLSESPEISEVYRQTTANNPIANFLGINEGRINHAKEVLKKWGPIIAIKAARGAIVTAINTKDRVSDIEEKYTSEGEISKQEVIGSDDGIWASIASDKRWNKSL